MLPDGGTQGFWLGLAFAVAQRRYMPRTLCLRVQPQSRYVVILISHMAFDLRADVVYPECELEPD